MSQHALAGLMYEQFRLVRCAWPESAGGLHEGTQGSDCFAPPRVNLQSVKPRLLDEPVPVAVNVPADVRQIEDLEIVQADSGQVRAIWNTLIDQAHLQGVATLQEHSEYQ